MARHLSQGSDGPRWSGSVLLDPSGINGPCSQATEISDPHMFCEKNVACFALRLILSIQRYPAVSEVGGIPWAWAFRMLVYCLRMIIGLLTWFCRFVEVHLSGRSQRTKPSQEARFLGSLVFGPSTKEMLVSLGIFKDAGPRGVFRPDLSLITMNTKHYHGSVVIAMPFFQGTSDCPERSTVKNTDILAAHGIVYRITSYEDQRPTLSIFLSLSFKVLCITDVSTRNRT